MDIGGGTTDIVVHGFDPVSPRTKPLQELIGGIGGLAGGSFVDAAFFKYLAKLFPGWKAFSKVNPTEAHRMRSMWETTKRGFDGKKTETVIDLSSKLAAAMRKTNPSSVTTTDDDEDFLVLKLETMRSFFDPVVDEIIALIKQASTDVQKLFPRRPMVMLLVGGFSESKYLKPKIEAAFASSMKIFQPPLPGSAVAKGAALYALTPRIVRVARYSFGAIAVSGTGQDVFDEFVKMGDVLPANHSVTRIYVPDRPLDNTIFVQIYAVKSAAIKLAADLKAFDANIRPEVDIVLQVPVELGDLRVIEVTMEFGNTHILVKACLASDETHMMQAVINPTQFM